MDPLFITVAPNGARKTKKDHPAIPITPEELAVEARSCLEAGASMIHLHVRDDNEGHSLDVGRYRAAMEAIQESCGNGILIQATTEAVGIYDADAQMAMVRELNPPSASVAIRELVTPGDEDKATAFFHEMTEEGVLLQYILYSDEDVRWFHDLRDRNIVPQRKALLLYVLGRYTKGQVSDPKDIVPFLQVTKEEDVWAVCAFGENEHLAAGAAAAMGGHVRVGFENNFLTRGKALARSNADLVRQVAEVSRALGRPLGSAAELREIVFT
ncbi:3-keto-5-aminohexanoate cleavage protein [Sneathiella sp. P13V-1]|uniref:3-keto-5-aminohexanoate cleavage protein n=1 Tax=Sneathiella sp. P13V-1 TaxID=2697366 RepID=UPI00187B8028|nr:3-keto-5-aminohexanoate cleavage protein [Sneathiella sp. P13V-1]MBE7638521.1 3-keto-5-aminohexanoate cleavage protein [Sneathiella sp. P13V-1]